MAGTRTKLPTAGSSPWHANHDRNKSRSLDRTLKGWMKVRTPAGRRRKKYITKVEGANLRELVSAVAEDLMRRRSAGL